MRELPDFHHPPPEIEQVVTVMRSLFDQQMAAVMQNREEDHLPEVGELWMHADALLDPKENGAARGSEDHLWGLAFLAAIALQELAKERAS